MSARVKDHPGYEVPSARTVSQGPQWDEHRTNPKLEILDGPEVGGRPTVRFRLPSMTSCEWHVDEVAGVLEDMLRRHKNPTSQVIQPKRVHPPDAWAQEHGGLNEPTVGRFGV